MKEEYIGAEAIVTIGSDRVIKARPAKAYRLAELDMQLRKQRTRREAKVLRRLANVIRVPQVLQETDDTLVLERIHGTPLKELKSRALTAAICKSVGLAVGRMHASQIVHGDLTTSNIMLENARTAEPTIAVVDFGLSVPTHKLEDMATDLHVFEELVPSECFEAFRKGYAEGQHKATEVFARLEKLKKRGRNKNAVG